MDLALWKNKSIKIEAANGLSPAKVLKLETKDGVFYIKSIDAKFSNTTYSAKREKEITQWLDGRLYVPKIIDFGVEEDMEFLILSELKGKHIAKFKDMPEIYITHLVNAIKKLHSIDITNCPFNSSLDIRLSELRYLLDKGLADIDINNWEKSTTFTNPNQLYKWLCDNKPNEDFVFSHGDISANYFINGTDYCFYDLGRAGIADKWLDIAFCVRDIREYKNKKYEDLFFDLLGIKPDYNKIEYFILLDELF